MLPPPCLGPAEPESSRVFTRAFSTAKGHRPSSGPTATMNVNGAATTDMPVLTQRRNVRRGYLPDFGHGGVGNVRLDAVRLIV